MTDPQPKTDKAHDVWRLVRDILTFLMGLFLLSWEVINADTPRFVVIGCAMALLGIPVANRILAGRNGNGAR